jgi:hypothetical protein
MDKKQWGFIEYESSIIPGVSARSIHSEVSPVVICQIKSSD